MLSNSKLTMAEKAERKAMIDNLPPGSSFSNDGKTTVLCIPDGSVTRFFSSVASPTENKFRRKVGEYHALRRFFKDADNGLILPGFWTAAMFLDFVSDQY